MNLTKKDYVGQDAPCKVVSNQIGVESKTGDCNEPVYIETNNFTPKDSETHSRKFDCESFGITEKDIDLVDMDDLF